MDDTCIERRKKKRNEGKERPTNTHTHKKKKKRDTASQTRRRKQKQKKTPESYRNTEKKETHNPRSVTVEQRRTCICKTDGRLKHRFSLGICAPWTGIKKKKQQRQQENTQTYHSS